MSPLLYSWHLKEVRYVPSKVFDFYVTLNSKLIFLSYTYLSFSPPWNGSIFFQVPETKFNTFCIFNHHKWPSELYCVVPQSLNLFMLLATLTSHDNQGEVEHRCNPVCLCFSIVRTLLTKWRSRPVSCRWLTGSSRCASRGRAAIASLSRHPELKLGRAVS